MGKTNKQNFVSVSPIVAINFSRPIFSSWHDYRMESVDPVNNRCPGMWTYIPTLTDTRGSALLVDTVSDMYSLWEITSLVRYMATTEEVIEM